MSRVEEGKCKRAIVTVISILLSYYVSIFLHEWGHGAVAWLFGYKANPFDIKYGGWLLLHVDEAVPYDQMLADHHGVVVALVGIAGVTVSITLFVLSVVILSKIRRGLLTYSFFYWLAITNMIPIFQYLAVQTFSVEGDVGRFVQGLAISPWWVFIPGIIFICFALYRLFRYIVPKAYAIIPVKAPWAQRMFLLLSLGMIFLLIYTHGYNPLSDKGMPWIGKCFALLSMALVPILFFLCDPSHKWVKKEIHNNQL